jgi:hypothetical protein
MRKLLIISIIIVNANFTYAQKADTSLWNKGGITSLGVSQSSFTNWAAGGINNVNITALVSLYANRKTAKTNWENNLDLGYGLQKISDGPYRKSEDRIELNSKWGMRMTDKINYSALLNFRSQFVEGFNFTDTSTVYVSNFLAPSFTTFSLGLDYKPIDGLSIYYSPFTAKVTTVFDDRLSAAGAFGVDSGERIRYELGTLAAIKYQKNIAANIQLKSKIDLFANFQTLQAIDVNWENILSFQIHKLLTATLTTNLIYDQDILIPKREETSTGVFTEANRPRTQFKQVFSLGLTYKF